MTARSGLGDTRREGLARRFTFFMGSLNSGLK